MTMLWYRSDNVLNQITFACLLFFNTQTWEHIFVSQFRSKLTWRCVLRIRSKCVCLGVIFQEICVYGEMLGTVYEKRTQKRHHPILNVIKLKHDGYCASLPFNASNLKGFFVCRKYVVWFVKSHFIRFVEMRLQTGWEWLRYSTPSPPQIRNKKSLEIFIDWTENVSNSMVIPKMCKNMCAYSANEKKEEKKKWNVDILW